MSGSQPKSITGRAAAPVRIEHAIARIARRQHGIITRDQLLALGLGPGAIKHWSAIGRLVRLHHGVYAVAYRPLSPLTHAMAAVLACGDGAVLSYGSALTLWRDGKNWDKPLEVTARTVHQHPGLRTHRSTTLTRRDATRQYGIPITSPSRTLYDNAPRLTDRALARAYNDLRLGLYLRPDDLSELLHRHPRTRAARRLRSYLQQADQAPTRSTFEDDFRAFAAAHALPEPRVNARVAGHEVDVYFPDHGLVVECDGWESHSDRASFEQDRTRDADLLERGIATIRLTKRRFDGDPQNEATRLHTILRGRTSWR